MRRRWSGSTLPSATALPSATTLPLPSLLVRVGGARGARGARGPRVRVVLRPDIASAPADSGRSGRPGSSVVVVVFRADMPGALPDPGRSAAPVVVAIVNTRGVSSPHHAFHDASEKAVTARPSAGGGPISPRGVAGPVGGVAGPVRGVAGPVRGAARYILRLAAPGGRPLSPSEELSVADRHGILDVQGA